MPSVLPGIRLRAYPGLQYSEGRIGAHRLRQLVANIVGNRASQKTLTQHCRDFTFDALAPDQQHSVEVGCCCLRIGEGLSQLRHTALVWGPGRIAREPIRVERKVLEVVGSN